MSQQSTTPSRLERLRRRHPWLDHLVRAEERYTDRHGDHYAAGITYFSVRALVRLSWLVAVACFLLQLAQS
jgi:membrane protein